MNNRIKKTTYFLISVCIAVPVILNAAAMQSASYQIESDSINIGGSRATSTSYIIEDTVGEIATGYSSSTSYDLHAGFQQMQETYISISVAPDISMTSMAGIGSVSSTGSTTWTVLTDSVAGYELSIRATSSPALQSAAGYSFADYTPSGVNPDYAFSIAATSSGFGYTIDGVDTDTRFLIPGALACGSGAIDVVDGCWDGFSTSDVIMSDSTSSNHPNGATTTVIVRAENGANHIQEAGTYTATLIVTAVAL